MECGEGFVDAAKGCFIGRDVEVGDCVVDQLYLMSALVNERDIPECYARSQDLHRATWLRCCSS